MDNHARVWCYMAARMACARWSLASNKSIPPAGDMCRETASAADFVEPGRWAIWKRQGRVRCLRRNRRVLLISSRVLSPRILTSGLWSVITNRSSQPWVKNRVCSRPQATARASPSIGAYLFSAGCKNLEPARVIRHPSRQQSGMSDKQQQ